MNLEEIYKRYKKSNKYVMFLDIIDIKFLFDEIERLKKENGRLIYEKQEKICFDEHRQFEDLKENTIPKQIIREKIEELRKKTANVVCDEINEIIIKVLQELLEGKKGR